MWIYKQGSGWLNQNTTLVGTGYAGREAGKNNPAMQNVKGIGPLPVGFYVIGSPHDYIGTKCSTCGLVHQNSVGKYALGLNPDSSNNMFGRDSFYMHGDSAEHPGLASHGCIVQQLLIRQKVATSTDKILKVEV